METTYNNGRTKLIDDRTAEQIETHKYLVTATDKFMSGWGCASNGLSKCAWACDTRGKQKQLLDWVRNRKDMKYINTTIGNFKPSNAAHVHIYVASDDHPAFY